MGDVYLIATVRDAEGTVREIVADDESFDYDQARAYVTAQLTAGDVVLSYRIA